MAPASARPPSESYAWPVAMSRADRKSTRLNSSHMSISYAVPRDLPSFPTRRSSDLVGVGVLLHDALVGLRVAGVAVVRADDRGELCGTLVRRTRHQGADGAGERAAAVGVVRVAGRHEQGRSEEHTSELQSHVNLVCRPTRSPLFPYTTLFRSCWRRRAAS